MTSTPPSNPSADASVAGKTDPAKPTLNGALRDVFATDDPVQFAEKLAGFSKALTNAHWACIWSLNADAALVQIAGDTVGKASEGLMKRIAKMLPPAPENGAEIHMVSGAILAHVALPDRSFAVLGLGVSTTKSVQNALAHERATFLSAMSFGMNAPKDGTQYDDLIAQIQSIARGEIEDLSDFVNLLAMYTKSTYAAAAFSRDAVISDVKISGQDKGAKRASLPQELKQEMKETARQRLIGQERSFAGALDQTDGLVIHLDKPRRHGSTLQLLSAIYALSQRKRKRRLLSAGRLVRAASAALILLGISLIPLPDGVELPAVVEAQSTRVITAPTTATLQVVNVRDGDQVEANESILFELDKSEIEVELIGIRAERAKAMLEREASRASRNAAALRNAELEVQRLDARVALLELRLASTRVVAPISGMVVAPNLNESVGTTVRQSEALMTISDPTVLTLKLSIPEAQIGKLNNGQTGIFRPDFDPTIRLNSEITLISPAGLGEEVEKMFLGRAKFLDDTGDVQLGLNGVLSVQRDTKPLGLIVYHEVRDYILLNFWF